MTSRFSRLRVKVIKEAISIHQSLSVIRLMATSASDKPPSFAHGLDCPKFTTTEMNGYEIRQFEPSKWVGTTISSMNRKSAIMSGFRKLFKYITGNNSTKTKVPMAVPVATKIVPGQGPACESNFTVMFFVPFSRQENTPPPSDQSLSIINLPAMTAYVASFGGYENDKKVQEHTEVLVSNLERDGKDYVKDYTFTAGYDPPYRFFGRHNEIWLLAEDIYK